MRKVPSGRGSFRLEKLSAFGRKLPSPLTAASRRLCWHRKRHGGRGKVGNRLTCRRGAAGLNVCVLGGYLVLEGVADYKEAKLRFRLFVAANPNSSELTVPLAPLHHKACCVYISCSCLHLMKNKILKGSMWVMLLAHKAHTVFTHWSCVTEFILASGEFCVLVPPGCTPLQMVCLLEFQQPECPGVL